MHVKFIYLRRDMVVEIVIFNGILATEQHWRHIFNGFWQLPRAVMRPKHCSSLMVRYTKNKKLLPPPSHNFWRILGYLLKRTTTNKKLNHLCCNTCTANIINAALTLCVIEREVTSLKRNVFLHKNSSSICPVKKKTSFTLGPIQSVLKEN